MRSYFSIKNFIDVIKNDFQIRTIWLRKFVVFYFLPIVFVTYYLIFMHFVPRYLPDHTLNPNYFLILPLMLLFIVVTVTSFYCWVSYTEKYFLKKNARKHGDD